MSYREASLLPTSKKIKVVTVILSELGLMLLVRDTEIPSAVYLEFKYSCKLL